MKGITAPLYNDLLQSGKHILIAGMTGSGKSVIMNGLINSILYENCYEHRMALADVKIVEFSRYRNTPHCIQCATNPKEVEAMLSGILNTINSRLEYMTEHGLKNYDGAWIHVFVDEMADLMLTSKNAADLLQRICQIGRAAKIQVIVATQCPLATVIPTRIKVNFPIIIGLHTATAQHSRNILEVNGCEMLPMYGEALIMYPTTGIKRVNVPMIPEEMIDKVVSFREQENGYATRSNVCNGNISFNYIQSSI